MKDLFIKRTGSTPEIAYKNTGVCSISGSSRPESLDDLYIQSKKFLRDLVKTGININFTFDFDYYNTLSQRYIYEILEILDAHKKCTIVWKYMDIDEDMQEMGEQYQEMFPKLKIKLYKKCIC